ncbi:hypothetical protein [Aurantimonas sp. Leaf443]|uniref:hypothetical protein n=1 Tax=Aurantimonas sp. Leaf443 TaxID=1736378 RepID=UPI0006FD79F8|nr:hypothetical protein [Aurantimonas sp. Leaf443]KQT82169.1 hypothetical protein ASG48_16125 [Aurantimonas sp. Leaf443]
MKRQELISDVQAAVEAARAETGVVYVNQLTRQLLERYWNRAGGVEPMITRIIVEECRRTGVSMRFAEDAARRQA